jgi:hypothetical protein
MFNIGINLYITEVNDLVIHFRGEVHSFVCCARASRAEKSSETALSLSADDVFVNNWWYVFNTNSYFGVDVATLTLIHNITS